VMSVCTIISGIQISCHSVTLLIISSIIILDNSGDKTLFCLTPLYIWCIGFFGLPPHFSDFS
jgi:hypothetical protein